MGQQVSHSCVVAVELWITNSGELRQNELCGRATEGAGNITASFGCCRWLVERVAVRKRFPCGGSWLEAQLGEEEEVARAVRKSESFDVSSRGGSASR